MTRRPYISKGIVELETLFSASASRETLEILLTELNHRKTKRANTLRERVERKLKGNSEGRKPTQASLWERTSGRKRGQPPMKTPHKQKAAAITKSQDVPPRTSRVLNPRPDATQLPTLAEPPIRSMPQEAKKRSSTAKQPPSPKAARQTQQLLSAWLALEVLSPQTYRKPEDLVLGDGRRIADFSVGGPLPWEGAKEKSRPNNQLFYHLVLGAVDMEKATKELLATFADSRPERPGYRDYSALATVTLNRNGTPLDDNSLAISSFGWGLPIACRGDLSALQEWPKRETELKEGLQTLIKKHDADGNLLPLDRRTISTAFAGLVSDLGLSDSLVVPPSFLVRTYQWFVIRAPPGASTAE